jgi:hypothetical protein
MQPKYHRRHKRNKTGLGHWLRYKFATDFDQYIQAMVYFGAAFLVIIVGLRGLGDLSHTFAIPKFLLDNDGKIDSNWVMTGLIIEFLMLCLLAAVSFFSPSEKRDDLQSSIESLSLSVAKLTDTIPSEIVQKLIASTQETAAAAERLLTDEIEILNNFRSKLDERLAQIDKDIIHVRQNIAQGIIDSSTQMESVIKQEKETLGKYNKLVDTLIDGATGTLSNISENISGDIKKTFATTAAVMTRQEKMIVKFYGINSKLLSEAQDSFNKFILSYSEMVQKESQRLEWLGSNQLRPEEFMNNMNKTNERLVSHLENIDNSLKTIMKQQGNGYDGVARKKSFWGWLSFGNKRHLDKTV